MTVPGDVLAGDSVTDSQQRNEGRRIGRKINFIAVLMDCQRVHSVAHLNGPRPLLPPLPLLRQGVCK